MWDWRGDLGKLGLKLGEPPPTVAVVRLSGVIGQVGGRRQGLSLETLAPILRRAFAVPRAKAVALLINSPGGSAVQSSLIAKRVRALAEEKKIKVLSFCEDVAASGGYWLALAGDEVYADASSIVGSIGVIFGGFGMVELIAKLGVERRLHTAGARKGMLDPFSAERPDDVAHLKRVQADIHSAFIDWVKQRRGAALKGDDEELFSGAFWAGRQAAELGLVDGVGDLRAVTRAQFGDKVRLRLVNPPPRRRFGLPWSKAQSGPAAWLEELAETIDQRALWSRYGL